MWANLSPEKLKKTLRLLDKKGEKRVEEDLQKQILAAIQQLCGNFRAVYNTLPHYDNDKLYHHLINLWKPLVSLLLEKKLPSWKENDLFWDSKQALLACCELYDTALIEFIKTINYTHIVAHCTKYAHVFPASNETFSYTESEKSETLLKVLQPANEADHVHLHIEKLTQARKRINQKGELPPNINHYFNDPQAPFQKAINTLRQLTNEKNQNKEKKSYKKKSKAHSTETDKTITQYCARILAETPELLKHIMSNSFLWQEMLSTIRQEGFDEAFLTMLRDKNLTAAADFITTPNDVIQQTLNAEEYDLSILPLTSDNIPERKEQLRRDPYNRVFAYQLAYCYFSAHTIDTEENLSETEKFHAIAGNIDQGLQHRINLIHAERCYFNIKDKIISGQNFNAATKKLHHLLTTLLPTEPLIAEVESSAVAHVEFNTLKTFKALLERIHIQCLSLLGNPESTDLSYITAYHLLYLAQSWFDSIGLKQSFEWVDLTGYKDRVQLIKSTTQDQDLLNRLQYFEEEKEATEKKHYRHNTIEVIDVILKKELLTYYNSSTEKGKNILNYHTTLAEQLQSELTEIMSLLKDFFESFPMFKPLLIKLWKICRSHYEMASIFSEAWITTTQILGSLYQQTDQLAYAQKAYLDILEKEPENILANAGLVSLHEPDNATVISTKQESSNGNIPTLSETLQTALNLATEADSLRETFDQFHTCSDSFIALNPINNNISQKIEEMRVEICEKYQAANNLLSRLTPKESKKFENELFIFSAYLKARIASSTNFFDIDKTNYKYILDCIDGVQNHLAPFQHSIFRQYQYLILLNFAKATEQNHKADEWIFMAKIYTTLLEEFQEANHVELADTLTHIYCVLFRFTEKTNFQKKAIKYAQLTVRYCLESKKENADEKLDDYVQRVTELTGKLTDDVETKKSTTLSTLIRKIIQSPNLLKLLEDLYIWQPLLGRLRKYHYDPHLIELFKKYNLNDALALLTKNDQDIQSEIQNIPIIYDPDLPLESANTHINDLKEQLKIQPYSISIIYQLTHAYLQQRMILTKSGVNAPIEVLSQNMMHIMELQTILEPSIPSLHCRIIVEQITDMFSHWQSNIEQQKAEGLGLLQTLVRILNTPISQLSEQAQTIANRLQQYHKYLETIQTLFRDAVTYILRSDSVDYITQQRLYHIMILFYKQQQEITFSESEKEELRVIMINYVEKIEAINEQLKAKGSYSKETNYHIDCMNADNRKAPSASASENSTIQHILGNSDDLTNMLNNKATAFDENDIHFINFKAGVEYLLQHHYIDALSSFVSIINTLTPETDEKYRLLYDDAYFFMADLTRALLVKSSVSIQLGSTVNCLAIALWKQCKQYYEAIKKNTSSQHCSTAITCLANVHYALGQALEQNQEGFLAQVNYKIALKYDPNHEPSKKVLAIVAPPAETTSMLKSDVTNQKTLLTMHSVVCNNSNNNKKATLKSSEENSVIQQTTITNMRNK